MRTADSRWRSRAAVIGHNVRYVLQISMLADIVFFAVAYVYDQKLNAFLAFGCLLPARLFLLHRFRRLQLEHDFT
jgi:hypothetical protein